MAGKKGNGSGKVEPPIPGWAEHAIYRIGKGVVLTRRIFRCSWARKRNVHRRYAIFCRILALFWDPENLRKSCQSAVSTSELPVCAGSWSVKAEWVGPSALIHFRGHGPRALPLGWNGAAPLARKRSASGSESPRSAMRFIPSTVNYPPSTRRLIPARGKNTRCPATWALDRCFFLVQQLTAMGWEWFPPTNPQRLTSIQRSPTP